MTAKRIILTDIEGTTSSISFVKNVLFPYARRELPQFVRTHADDPDVRQWLAQVRNEIGDQSHDNEIAINTLIEWIDQDRKHTALKALQGLIWKAGYVHNDYAAHIYDDAVAALRQWHAQGRELYVYSSGSVSAQKLLFAHSTAGDLTPLFNGYFDTQIGGKRDPQSYQNILAALEKPADQVLFLSDVVEELDAARATGMATVLVDRPDDYPVARTIEANNGHQHVRTFSEIKV